MIIGIRKELVEKGKGIDIKTEEIMMGKIKRGKKDSIIGVYVRKEGLKKKLEKLEEWTEGSEDKRNVIIGGILPLGQEEGEGE